MGWILHFLSIIWGVLCNVCVHYMLVDLAIILSTFLLGGLTFCSSTVCLILISWKPIFVLFCEEVFHWTDIFQLCWGKMLISEYWLHRTEVGDSFEMWYALQEKSCVKYLICIKYFLFSTCIQTLHCIAVLVSFFFFFPQLIYKNARFQNIFT